MTCVFFAFVILSAAKDLRRVHARSFAALRMTVPKLKSYSWTAARAFDMKRKMMKPCPLMNHLYPVVYCLSLVVYCPLLIGCGGGGPELVSVRGKVTLGGGSWPRPGSLYFTSVATAKGGPQRPALGRFGADGGFTVTTLTEGDGLVPGTYRVAVQCCEPAVGGPGEGLSHVPLKYSSPATSGLEITIKPGTRGPVNLEFDIPKR